MGARFHQPVRLRSLRQGECLEDLRPDLALGQERPHPGLERPGDFRLFGDAARPERRTGQGQPLQHDGEEIDLDLGALEEGDIEDEGAQDNTPADLSFGLGSFERSISPAYSRAPSEDSFTIPPETQVSMRLDLAVVYAHIGVACIRIAPEHRTRQIVHLRRSG